MDLLEPGSASDSDEDQRRGGVLKPAMVMPPVSSVSMSSFIPHDHCVLPYAQPRPEPYVQEVFYAGNNPIVPGDRTLVGNRPRKKRRKREDGDTNLGESHIDGPWVPSSDETFDEEDDECKLKPLTEEERKAREDAALQEQEAERRMVLPTVVSETIGDVEDGDGMEARQCASDSSVFFGESERDYQGRSWITPPPGIDLSLEPKCRIPKKAVHTYKGHTKGVQSIEFFPRYGHLLLSGSMDSTIRIWDVFKDKQCMRSYHGHTAAVRGVQFRPGDGAAFLSFGYDSKIKIWDAESGQCTSTLSNGVLPYGVVFSPTEPHMILAACKDKRIIQYDARSGDNVQEYDHHLDAVNTITFYDEGRRFVTTSDDKRVLCWEYGVPTPIKYIADISMHAIPAVSLAPSGLHMVGQSLDNSIVAFDTRKNFTWMKKRAFKGHMVAGYACQVNFSTNGSYIMSGDGQGKLCFWDWNSTKMIKKVQAHRNGPCIGAVWHPTLPSTVATCGWDSAIKLWA